MVSATAKVIDKMGLHMRPAQNLIKEMTGYKSEITIIYKDTRINAKSIMNIMAACIKYGSEITIECSGEDEQAMLEKAVSLIESGLE